MKRWIAIAVLLLVVGAVVHHCYLRPEAKVEAAVVAAITAIENEDRDAVKAFFHPQFQDLLGLGAEEWMMLLDYSRERYKQVDIKLIQPDVEVDGEKATFRCHVRVDATVAETISKQGPPSRPTAYRQNVELTLAKDGSTWRLVGIGDVTAAEWGIPVDRILGGK
ncbi:MAG: hypothetical protein P9L99_03500 [Candidatus Lernaella stagnicola]|nr:hypothetical protein [Candidatus Lernaella stagnicola]